MKNKVSLLSLVLIPFIISACINNVSQSNKVNTQPSSEISSIPSSISPSKNPSQDVIMTSPTPSNDNNTSQNPVPQQTQVVSNETPSPSVSPSTTFVSSGGGGGGGGSSITKEYPIKGKVGADNPNTNVSGDVN